MIVKESQLRKIINDEVDNHRIRKILKNAVPPCCEGIKLVLEEEGEGEGEGEDEEVEEVEEEPESDIPTEEDIQSEDQARLAKYRVYEREIGRGNVIMMNNALAEVGSEITYRSANSPSLNKLWPAWSQFCNYVYEPTTKDEQGRAYDFMPPPEELYANWDQNAAKFGYKPREPRDFAEFVRARGIARPDSFIDKKLKVEVLRGQVITQSMEGARAAISELGPLVNQAMEQVSFPVTENNMITLASILAQVVREDSSNLSRLRWFAALYAVRNATVGESLPELALLLVPGGLAMRGAKGLSGGAAAMGAVKGALGAGSGWKMTLASIAGLGAGASLLGDGRTIIQMIQQRGSGEIGAVLGAIRKKDKEMVEDIKNVGQGVMAIGSSGLKIEIRDALASMLDQVIQGEAAMTKSAAIGILSDYDESLRDVDIGDVDSPAAQPEEEASVEVAAEALDRLIGQLILEDTLGVPTGDMGVFLNPPIEEIEEEEEEEEEEEDEDGTGSGRRRRGVPGYDVRYSSARPRISRYPSVRRERMRRVQTRRDTGQAARIQRRGERQQRRQGRRDATSAAIRARLNESKENTGEE